MALVAGFAPAPDVSPLDLPKPPSRAGDTAEPGPALQRATVVPSSGPDGSGLAPVGPSADSGGTPTPLPSAGADERSVARFAKQVVEQCDGRRREVADPPESLGCSSWRVDWVLDGRVWGSTSAPARSEVIDKRERVLGFARQYARLFGKPANTHFASPSVVVCDACTRTDKGGLWGVGQKFSAVGVSAALVEARSKLRDFDADFFTVHAPLLPEVARLTQHPRTKPAALAYAKQLEGGLQDLAEIDLALDNAKVFRSEDAVRGAIKKVERRAADLDKSLATLRTAVAKEVASAHGGRYTEDGAAGPTAQQVTVAFKGNTVVATHILKGAKSVWFEGTVALDGSISGQSLVAPQHTALKCQDYTEACGYEYASAFLRFSKRGGPGRPEVLELWFKRDSWIPSRPFSR